MFSMDSVIVIAVVIMVVLLVIGIIKKTFWICAIAAAILIAIGLVQPAQFTELKENIVEVVDKIIDPFADDNYADIGDEAGVVDKDEMDEIDKEYSDVLGQDGK